MAFLMELCAGGRVVVVMGGPPCRTITRLRYVQPGPPPLRTREGEQRFGRSDLPVALQQKVDDDSVLWFRMLLFYMVAEEAATKKVGFIVESPQDPETYLEQKSERERCASYLRDRYQLKEFSWDQGPMGHQRRKPTTIGTNVEALGQLHEVRGRA